MGRVTTSAKPCTALTPSFSLACLMSTAAHAGKVVFNNQLFGKYLLSHIHTVHVLRIVVVLSSVSVPQTETNLGLAVSFG